MRMRITHAYLLVAVVLVVGCSSTSDNTVAVTGTDTSCTASATEVAAGKVTFEFENKSSQVNELYVLRANKKVVAELENVTSGITRSLNADLSSGIYTLTCKPGMKGEGISSTIKVVGDGGAGSAS